MIWQRSGYSAQDSPNPRRSPQPQDNCISYGFCTAVLYSPPFQPILSFARGIPSISFEWFVWQDYLVLMSRLCVML